MEAKDEHPSFFVKTIPKKKYVLINFTYLERNISVFKTINRKRVQSYTFANEKGFLLGFLTFQPMRERKEPHVRPVD